MKYHLLFLVSTVSLILSANGEIPDYIHVCKRSDPELTKCILNSILNLREKLASGIPEFEVPPLDPLHMENLEINLGPGFKAAATNLIVTGGKNFKINDLTVDIDANVYSFNVTLPELVVTGTYEVDANIGAIPLKGRGPMRLTTKTVSGQGTLRGKHVVREGKTYNWFPTMSYKVDVEDYEVKLENLFDGQPAIGEVTNKLLNQEKAEILRSILPALEKVLTKHFLKDANNIVKHFTWDELFPES